VSASRARGHIDGDHEGARVVDGVDPGREIALGRSRQARPKDGVDDNLRVTERQLVGDKDAEVVQRIPLARRCAAQPARVHTAHGGEPAPPMEVSCGGKPVASVVSHSAYNSSAAAAKAGDLPARRLHQPVHRDAEALLRQAVDLGDLETSEGR